jgi:hypothetical protein
MLNNHCRGGDLCRKITVEEVDKSQSMLPRLNYVGKIFRRNTIKERKNNNVGVTNGRKLCMKVISKTYGQRIGRILLANYCYYNDRGKITVRKVWKNHYRIIEKKAT